MQLGSDVGLDLKERPHLARCADESLPALLLRPVRLDHQRIAFSDVAVDVVLESHGGIEPAAQALYDVRGTPRACLRGPGEGLAPAPPPVDTGGPRGGARTMKDFRGKLAVVTGGGTGMGRALAEQLIAEGCHVAICDVSAENMAETKQLCETRATSGARISTHLCDVSDERQVIAFRDAVKTHHGTDHLHLLFNNAGIGGGGSFLNDDRADWDKTFGVCWSGVYYCTRAFLPLLVASDGAYLVNTSSVNGFWACLGPATAHTAYSSAKFAVKGFSEALRVDLRLNAPHVKVAVVMPGHVGTSIILNSAKVLGKPSALEMGAKEVAALRDQLVKRGLPVANLTDDQVRGVMHQIALGFRDNAPVTAAQAATMILDGVRKGAWRILVGDDAHALDRMVREDPESAYEEAFMENLRGQKHLSGLP